LEARQSGKLALNIEVPLHEAARAIRAAAKDADDEGMATIAGWLGYNAETTSDNNDNEEK
jgi:hypothetical protein